MLEAWHDFDHQSNGLVVKIICNKTMVTDIFMVTFGMVLMGPALLASGASLARPLNAKCLLQIDGRTYLDGACRFTADSSGDSDFFSDEKLLVVCPDGRSAAFSNCYGYEQRVARNGYFGYLFRSHDVASLCWNEGTMRKASPCFESLQRNGACWFSAQAKSRHADTYHRVRFCAWAV